MSIRREVPYRCPCDVAHHKHQLGSWCLAQEGTQQDHQLGDTFSARLTQLCILGASARRSHCRLGYERAHHEHQLGPLALQVCTLSSSLPACRATFGITSISREALWQLSQHRAGIPVLLKFVS